MPSKNLKYTETILKDPIKIKYKDIFDFKEFVSAMHEWLKQYGWIDLEDKKDHFENWYAERVDRNGNKEIWMQWRPFKPAEGAPINFYLDINFHLLGFSSTEIVKDGNKMKVNKGEMELTIVPIIEKVYEKEFNKDSLLKQFVTLFNQRIYIVTLIQRKKELYREAYVLQQFVKQWFKLKRYLPYEEAKGFFPSYAWPVHLKE